MKLWELEAEVLHHNAKLLLAVPIISAW